MRTWPLLLGVGAIAVAAVVDAVSGGASEAPVDAPELAAESSAREGALAGPFVPPAGALPGKLVVAAGEECALRVVDLASRTLEDEGLSTGCAVWPSPDGKLAAVSAPREPGTRLPLARVVLVRLGDPPEVLADLGLAAGEAAWSPEGARVAVCGQDDRTVVYDAAGVARSEVAGCGPRFTPAGALLTSPSEAFGGRLLGDGALVLGTGDLLRGFDRRTTGQLDVLAYDESPDGLLAVSALRLEPLGSRAVLELWRDGGLLAAIELPRRYGVGSGRLGEFLRFSPSGALLAIGPSASRDFMIFADLRLRRVAIEVDHQRGFAWSPDGQWLAVALADDIAIYGLNSSEIAYRIPLTVEAIGWIPGLAGADG